MGMNNTAVYPWDDWTLVFATVVVGVVVVFIILVVLIVVFSLVGGITHRLEKLNSTREAVAANGGVADNMSKTLPSAIVAPVAHGSKAGGISGEVVAAITAAVAAYGGGRVVGIRKRETAGVQRGRRTRWGQAGVYGNLK